MMINSMTAYGFGAHECGGLSYQCEVRTLNSRYLEVSVRLPRPLVALEVDVINHVKGALRRGKVDVFIELAGTRDSADLPELDGQAVRHFQRLHDGLARTLAEGTSPLALAPVSFTEFLKLEGVLATPRKGRGPAAADLHREAVFAALGQALGATKRAREDEGRALHSAMKGLLAELEQGRAHVAAKRDSILPSLYRSFVKRVEQSLAVLQKGAPGAAAVLPQSAILEERLMAEVSLQSDKLDVDEELTRLGAHIGAMASAMRDDDGPGRKLDFLCQEMHREVNTMGNKLVTTDVAQLTIEMKQVVERLRQQVQNIE